MEKKKIKQRFFMARELRLSLTLMVVWSLLAGILFAYITKELGTTIEHGIFSFIVVFIGYVIIVVSFVLFFTHRLLGPFERLKMEIRLILAGDYRRRLHIRGNDDFYVRSFIAEVNKILDAFEEKCIDKEGFRKNISPEMLDLISLTEKERVPKEKIREAVLSLHEKIESLLKKNKE